MGKLSRSIFNQSGSILFGLAPLLYSEKCVLHELYQSPSVFYEYALYCGIAWRQTFQEWFEFITFHIPLLKLLYFSGKNDAEKLRDRKRQICRIQFQVTTRQMAFTCNRKSLKKSRPFLEYTRAYLRKGRYVPEYVKLYLKCSGK